MKKQQNLFERSYGSKIARRRLFGGKLGRVLLQDIYFVPRMIAIDYMRIGDERRFIQTYDFDQLSAVISHFKFLAGMNVGEKRRSQLGSCDYRYDDKKLNSSVAVGDYHWIWFGYSTLHDELR